MKITFKIVVFAILIILSSYNKIIAQKYDWKPVPGHIMTKWAKEVNPKNVHSNYPRPQMVRKQWMNLNGIWQFDTTETATIPFNKNLSGHILVPFPIESALSGVMKHCSHILYRRNFTLPKNWEGKRILLHFGAVDWETTVYINSKNVGTHRGGYDPFTFDITNDLNHSGSQEIIVKVFDPTDAGMQPRGKQSINPKRIYYTPITGIWQTVWLEPVNKVYINKIKIVPNIDSSYINVNVSGNFDIKNYALYANISAKGEILVRESGICGKIFKIHVPNEKLWSPSHPYLYDLKLSLVKNGKVVDKIRTYFGMRKISIGKDKKGITRILLNNKFIFLDGPLFQGYFPDGLYTAPNENALKYDIQVIKELGFNMVRVHQVVEPQRWYYWCDKLGLIIFQDMPAAHIAKNFKSKKTIQTDKEFKTELGKMIKEHWNHPSIGMWVLFNEGWGQHNTINLTSFIKSLDPSRLVDDASGWVDKQVGDVIDVHHYPGPISPVPETHRAAILGEFGGLGLPVLNHIWKKKNWGYKIMHNSQDLLNHYRALFKKVWQLKDNPGLSAAVYTQLTDVETEVNGLMTYDRKVLKINPKKAYQIDRGKIQYLPIVK